MNATYSGSQAHVCTVPRFSPMSDDCRLVPARTNHRHHPDPAEQDAWTHSPGGLAAREAREGSMPPLPAIRSPGAETRASIRQRTLLRSDVHIGSRFGRGLRDRRTDFVVQSCSRTSQLALRTDDSQFGMRIYVWTWPWTLSPLTGLDGLDLPKDTKFKESRFGIVGFVVPSVPGHFQIACGCHRCK